MKNQKGFVIPLIIAIVAILAIGGGYWFYSLNTSFNHSALPIESTSTPSTIATTTEVVAGSIVYTNTQYGFELKFPPSWKDVKVTEGDGTKQVYTGITFSLPNSDGNYRDIFGINYLTEAEVQASKPSNVLGKNDNGQTFHYILSAYATEKQAKDIKDLIAPTFKFISNISFCADCQGFIIHIKAKDFSAYREKVNEWGYLRDASVTDDLRSKNLISAEESNDNQTVHIYKVKINGELTVVDLDSYTKYLNTECVGEDIQISHSGNGPFSVKYNACPLK
jgi:tRNA threonylcarbamoyladenosine modification (KEOPS) complex  Pcc1 subunit